MQTADALFPSDSEDNKHFLVPLHAKEGTSELKPELISQKEMLYKSKDLQNISDDDSDDDFSSLVP